MKTKVTSFSFVVALCVASPASMAEGGTPVELNQACTPANQVPSVPESSRPMLCQTTDGAEPISPLGSHQPRRRESSTQSRQGAQHLGSWVEHLRTLLRTSVAPGI